MRLGGGDRVVAKSRTLFAQSTRPRHPPRRLICSSTDDEVTVHERGPLQRDREGPPLHLQARERAERARLSLVKGAAEAPLVGALKESEDALRGEHRRLMQVTFYAVPGQVKLAV